MNPGDKISSPPPPESLGAGDRCVGDYKASCDGGAVPPEGSTSMALGRLSSSARKECFIPLTTAQGPGTFLGASDRGGEDTQVSALMWFTFSWRKHNKYVSTLINKAVSNGKK